MKNIEQELKENGIYITKTSGDSMMPMLVSGRDRVIIIPPKFPLKKYDVPVYRRDSHYTMHRIVHVTRNGYVICGDNRTHLERDIKDGDIIGVLTAFYSGEKLISCDDSAYIDYCKKICRALPRRIIKAKFKRLISISKKFFN